MHSDLTIREAAVRRARMLSLTWGDAVPASELSRGFIVGDRRIHLVAWGRGVFKPKELNDGPLTLVSSLASTYEDEHLDNDVLLYDYAPSGSNEWANNGLKQLAHLGRSVILLRQVKKKPFPEYMILAPVAIVGADDVMRKFHLSLSTVSLDASGVPAPVPTVFSKAYADTMVKARLHQAHFRRETLMAYGNTCSVCKLGERILLDAAHILPDRIPEGLATVSNGLSMCPTHHRAFDKNLMHVSPEYRVQIARDRLEQVASDATARMLLDFDGCELHLPKASELRPRAEFLRRRMELAV